MSGDAPRVAPGTLGEVGVFAWLAARVGGVRARTGPLNLFLTLGRHRGLFCGWLWFAGRLMPRGRLPRRETELVILRVAHLRGCAYEYQHHLRVGRSVGLSKSDIAGACEGPSHPGWSLRERAILDAVDALHADGDMDDPTWERLRQHLDDRECIELCMLAGHYQMLATVITALRIQPEQPEGRVLQ